MAIKLIPKNFIFIINENENENLNFKLKILITQLILEEN